MTETLTSNEKSYRNSICCAFSMARFADVELSQQQAEDYADARANKECTELSDQKLLYFFLDEYQQEAFRIRYAHMDFGVLPEQIDKQLIPFPIIHQIGEQALMLAQVS